MLVTVVKVLQALLIPPGLLLVAAVLAVILAALGKRRVALVVTCTACALVAVLSLGPVSDVLLRPLEGRFASPTFSEAPSVGADAIVLLGGGTTPRSPDAGGRDVLSQAATRRALYAASLQRRLGLPVISTGGRVAPDPSREPEATVAARQLRDLGVPAARILEEAESRTTWENALAVRDRFHPKRVVLVTSAVHMPRAVACFNRLEIEVVPAPTDYLSQGTRTFLDWLPSSSALEDSLTAIHEYAGIVGYRALYGARPAQSARASRN